MYRLCTFYLLQYIFNLLYNAYRFLTSLLLRITATSRKNAQSHDSRHKEVRLHMSQQTETDRMVCRFHAVPWKGKVFT